MKAHLWDLVRWAGLALMIAVLFPPAPLPGLAQDIVAPPVAPAGPAVGWGLAETDHLRGGGIESLSGSYVSFDGSVGGSSTCWTANSPAETFCFKAVSYTDEGEPVYALFMKFPSDWTVTDVYYTGTPWCERGHFDNNFYWDWITEPYEFVISHPRIMNGTDTCTAYYCVTATPGSGEGSALESWYWTGYDSSPFLPPHYPCSNDRYTPAERPECDEWIKPQASIPDCMGGADLITSTKVSPGHAARGDPVSYTISIINTGVEPANGAMMTDAIPAYAIYNNDVWCSSGTCSYSSGTNQIEWSGTVGVGETVTVSFTVDTDSVPCPSTMVNEARIGAEGVQPFTRSANTEIHCAELSTSKKVATGHAAVGDWVCYTVSIINTSSFAANGAVMSDPIPEHATYNNDVECSWPTSCSYNSQANQIEWSGTVYGNSIAWVSFTVDTDSVPCPSTMVNEATISALGIPAFTRLASTEIHCADLSTSTKTAPDNVAVGDPVNYTVSIINSSSFVANGVVMSDPIPANATYNNDVWCSSGTCSYNSVSNQIEWTGTVNQHSTVTVSFSVDTQSVPCPSTMVNEATISALGVPAFPRSASTEIHCADLSTSTKTAPDYVAAGDPVNYTISIINGSSFDANGAMMTDPIPANTTYNNDVECSWPTSCSYNSQTNQIEWDGTVYGKSTAWVSFSVDTQSVPYPSTLENVATISALGVAAFTRSASTSVYDPTSVDLIRFEAWPEGPKTVHVQWETAQEISNLGFNLYRSDSSDGPKTKLNETLIPTLVPPGSPFGAVYDWFDRAVRPNRTYFYWLEDLDIYGHTTMHDPVEVHTRPRSGK